MAQIFSAVNKLCQKFMLWFYNITFKNIKHLFQTANNNVFRLGIKYFHKAVICSKLQRLSLVLIQDKLHRKASQANTSLLAAG